MANWNALRWSETVTTGNPTACAVLLRLCLKCDDNGVVYRDAAGVAALCEMSTRTLKTWRDYLDEREFITVIRRIRRDGREAKPLTLINYPEAPHLNGEMVRLDYNGKYMYPKDPDAIREAGISWIAGEDVEQLHPSATSTRGPSATSTRGTNSNANDNSQVTPSATSTPRPRANRASHVGGQICTPKAVPQGSTTQPTKTSTAKSIPTAPSKQADGGWLGSFYDQGEGVPAESSGARLLRTLTMPGQATPLTPKAVQQWAPTVDAALTGVYSPVALIERLTNGLHDTRNPAGVVVRRLDDLDAELRQARQRQGNPVDVPEWCGECGSHYPDERAKKNPKFRLVLDPATDTERRCTCHPKHPDRQPQTCRG